MSATFVNAILSSNYSIRRKTNKSAIYWPFDTKQIVSAIDRFNDEIDIDAKVEWKVFTSRHLMTERGYILLWMLNNVDIVRSGRLNGAAFGDPKSCETRHSCSGRAALFLHPTLPSLRESSRLSDSVSAIQGLISVETDAFIQENANLLTADPKLECSIQGQQICFALFD